MLSQWLLIMCAMLNRTVVNHVVLYWAGCVWVMVCHAEPLVMTDMRQWLWIMVCYAGPVAVNHGVLCCASGCESWCAMLSKWLWIMLYYTCESWWVILSQWLWIMVCYVVTVVVSHGEFWCATDVNHGVLCWASGWELCCAMLIRVVVSHGV